MRGAVVVVAAVAGLDAIDEYFPLMARDWGLSTGVTPVTLAVISLAGAVGAATAGRTVDLSNRSLGRVLVAAAVLLGVLGAARFPVGLAAVSVGYGLYRMVAVAYEIRLQDLITGPSRATVSSVAALGTELSGLLLLGAWAAGGMTGAMVLMMVVAILVIAVTVRSVGAHQAPAKRSTDRRRGVTLVGDGTRDAPVGVFACFVAGVLAVVACGATTKRREDRRDPNRAHDGGLHDEHGHDTTPTHGRRAGVRVAHRGDRPGGPRPHGRPVDASRLPGRIRGAGPAHRVPHRLRRCRPHR